MESEYGVGSVFTARIPQTVTDASPFTIEDQKQSATFFSSRFTARDAHILVVDDLPTNLTVVEGLLAPYQMEIDTVLSGEEAVRLVKAKHYDLVLMDHMMPKMDGVEAAALIRKWESEQKELKERGVLGYTDSAPPPNGAATPQNPQAIIGSPQGGLPIIALTANAVSGMKEMFLEKGFNDYLSKPIDVSKLDEILARWIPRSKQKKSAISTKETGKKKNEKLEAPHSLVIPGIDVQRGIAMTGGTLEGYRKVLPLFRRDVEERLVFLRNFAAQSQGPAKQDLPLFVTQVHALKSASGSLGAAEVSAKAAALEAAGKAEDMTSIREQLPGFVEQLTALTEGIKNDAPPIPHPSSLIPHFSEPVRRLLGELTAALEAQKAEDVDRLLEELDQQKIDPKTRKALDAISDQVLMAEYGEAMGIIKKLVKKNNGEA